MVVWLRSSHRNTDLTRRYSDAAAAVLFQTSQFRRGKQTYLARVPIGRGRLFSPFGGAWFIASSELSKSGTCIPAHIISLRGSQRFCPCNCIFPLWPSLSVLLLMVLCMSAARIPSRIHPGIKYGYLFIKSPPDGSALQKCLSRPTLS